MENKSILKGVLFVAMGASFYGMLATFVKIAYDQGYTTAEVTTSWLIKFVAKTVPNNTKTIAINFLAEGNCLPKILSTKILIQTVCINNTIAIDTLIYCTAR